jgi:hypothetical protein
MVCCSSGALEPSEGHLCAPKPGASISDGLWLSWQKGQLGRCCQRWFFYGKKSPQLCVGKQQRLGMLTGTGSPNWNELQMHMGRDQGPSDLSFFLFSEKQINRMVEGASKNCAETKTCAHQGAAFLTSGGLESIATVESLPQHWPLCFSLKRKRIEGAIRQGGRQGHPCPFGSPLVTRLFLTTELGGSRVLG